MVLPTHQAFTHCIGNQFRVRIQQDHSIYLVLQSVSSLLESPLSTPSQIIEHFSVIFVCEEEVQLPQQTYIFAHDALGEFAIFIVPIGPDRITKKMQYQAIFN